MSRIRTLFNHSSFAGLSFTLKIIRSKIVCSGVVIAISLIGVGHKDLITTLPSGCDSITPPTALTTCLAIVKGVALSAAKRNAGICQSIKFHVTVPKS